ncbi:AraC family transcriptional regulator [Hahella sp. CCB-MM4]|uniref:AraC family transcriptional regulator n=1 Tax=Hahella sp. (strain CCB-MM4) TaxID=1926491 RepID=UPI000B9BD300|nr:AraC family transcriptional regulator [Hahella sp. CCB-MM4]OZG72626.1 AraC family transcriptional regulator [Hahella sp. CCB-MM4]
MTLSNIISQTSKYIDFSADTPVDQVSPMPGLILLKSSRTTELAASIYHPVICLILQGAKETTVGERTLSFAAGESLIVSHTVPVISRITRASDKEPYLAMILEIDLGILRALYHEIEEIPADKESSTALNVDTAGEDLLNAMSRYLALADRGVEKKVMAPLLLKEIHFRLLMAPHGKMLRRLLEHDSYASQISRAIAHLRDHFRQPLSMPMLAKNTGMSESSFYANFKKVTETTPLQYQKEMRLIEAQRLLRNGHSSVSSVAFEVGYESPTQFSREYSRKFGVPPSEEMASVRVSV